MPRLLETAARDASATGSRTFIGDYFASCLATQAIEAKGLASLAPERARTAELLQPPFVDSSQPDAVNLSELGGIIGRALTHAFDEQGRKFDGHGNLSDWWTPEDLRQYEAGAACFVNQYSAFTAVEEVKVNGKLTLGENIADNGGLRLAYRALHALGERARHATGKFTDDQVLFLAFAQSQCNNVSPKTLRLWAATDPHAPQKVHVNGTVSNLPEFQQAFHCKSGDAMAPAKRCRIR